MRRGLGIVISTLFTVLAVAGFAVPAGAATTAYGDEIESFTIAYTVSEDGVLHVTETIDYTFAESGRHGIYRDLVIREPYADDQSKDQKYEVSNILVSSPTAPDRFTKETAKYNLDRDQTLRIKIGSKDQTIWGTSAKYVISYDVRGALRHFADHSELYWDATGSAWDAHINKVTVSVQVPQGVQQVECYSGKAGSTSSCEKKSLAGGIGLFTGSKLVRGEQLTIVAGIKAGAVRNDTPIVVDPPNWLERSGLSWLALAGSVLATVAGVAAAFLFHRRGPRDQRYVGVPPGTVPPANAQIGKDQLAADQIPVAFAPPEVTVAEGAVLADAADKSTTLAATLIHLAVRGAIRLDNTDEGARKAVLVDPEVATAQHEKVLLKGLFPKQEPGEERALERAEVGDYSLVQAADKMYDAVWTSIKRQEWYLRLPAASGNGDGSTALGWMLTIALVILCFGIGQIGSGPATAGRVIAIIVPGSALLTLLWMWIGRKRRGLRSAEGRAITDQVLGFQQYLATAEADQLRFEEGEDIFSKYLPWAIAFRLATRWQRVCGELVEAGRLTPDPTWYVGPSYYHSNWSASSISTAVQSTFVPPPAPAPAAGSGGGSSSGFSSYSSSSSSSGSSGGGGGGGGGGGSW
ncbi:DUF2207 domain-containing protein [Kribbella speibonae]|uniref:DUF2207 domain-containing protein n=1 Tax=Kribbella speibonae TaxID=1572660 RepID=A0A4R0IWE0_9ACTN|nr:DUF2207 domain-containing protein [Kribbella speibonae]TCC37537.1 DUF2207 domain-containing protein [Kribbella speibonae]